MRRGKYFQFDFNDAIPKAWDLLWADNLKQRKKDKAYEKHNGRPPFNASRTYFLCAADIENQVRRWAEDTAAGKPWTQERGYGGYGFAVRIRGDLKGAVRKWLLRNPAIEGHNFGRGHISGMRFRPAGQPMAPAEVKTVENNEKRRNRPRIRHFSFRYSGPLLCMEGRKRSAFSRHRSHPWTTRKYAEVTCPRCLRLLNEKHKTPVASAPGQGSINHMPDDNTHN